MINATVSIGMNSTLSDAKGNFFLEHVPPGIVKIRVKSPTTRFYDSSVDVLVETDKRKNLFIFLKEVTGTVEGVITDESGKLLVGAKFTVFSGLERMPSPPKRMRRVTISLQTFLAETILLEQRQRAT